MGKKCLLSSNLWVSTEFSLPLAGILYSFSDLSYLYAHDIQLHVSPKQQMLDRMSTIAEYLTRVGDRPSNSYFVLSPEKSEAIIDCFPLLICKVQGSYYLIPLDFVLHVKSSSHFRNISKLWAIVSSVELRQ